MDEWMDLMEKQCVRIEFKHVPNIAQNVIGFVKRLR